MRKMISVATLAITVLTLNAGEVKQLFTFDSETGAVPSQFTKERRWTLNGDDNAGTMEIVRAGDHALGGKALRITKRTGLTNFDRLRVQTRLLNFKAGTAYLVSGWFKADRGGLAQMQMTSPWANNKKQWFKPVNFRVDQEWKRYTFEFDVPEATAGSTLADGKLYLTFGLFQNSLNELYAKDIVWEAK